VPAWWGPALTLMVCRAPARLVCCRVSLFNVLVSAGTCLWQCCQQRQWQEHSSSSIRTVQTVWSDHSCNPQVSHTTAHSGVWALQHLLLDNGCAQQRTAGTADWFDPNPPLQKMELMAVAACVCIECIECPFSPSRPAARSTSSNSMAVWQPDDNRSTCCIVSNVAKR